MTTELERLIERAREYRQTHDFSQEERDDQARSFAYGNVRLANGVTTMADIDRALALLNSATL